MKAPIIVLIILLFVAIFLYGSVLEPYTGEGLYHGRVQSTQGTQWLDTIIRFEEPEGGRQVFTMYNIIFETGEEDSPVESMTKITVQYSGNYFKHVFGPLFLRPTGIHFPVIDFEGHGKFVMNWEIVSSWSLDAQGQPIEGYEYTTAPHRSTNDMTETGMNFETLPYQRVEEIPAKLMECIEILDAAEPVVVKVQ
jgi:hypothetical protein